MSNQNDISLYVNVQDGYSLCVYPHPDPTGLGLDPNSRDKHFYKTVQELYEFLKKHSLPQVPDLASLKEILNAQSQNNTGSEIAKISRDMAEKMGFSA